MHPHANKCLPLCLVATLVVLGSAIAGCGGAKPTDPGPQASQSPGAAQSGTPAPEASAAEEPVLPPPAAVAALPPGVHQVLGERFTGDLDQMIARRLVRLGVTYNRSFYFVDKGVQRGVSYELGKAFEDELNKGRPIDERVSVFFAPMARDQLAQALTDGRVDAVAAQVTVRPELQPLTDFSNPTRTNVNEVVVTGPGAPSISSEDDLAGQEVHARTGDKYYQSLIALNGRLKARGRPPVVIIELPGNLEDDDVLEMVNAGLVPVAVVDDYLAAFWAKVLPNLRIHDAVKLRTGANIAIAMRKNSPRLVAAVNAFLAKYGLGTAIGNVLEKRYLASTTFVRQAASDTERRKLQALVELFRKYGTQYEVPYLLMAAQGYQESQLDQNAKSHVGAIGVMQLMPATGSDMKVGDITKVDANIHAGVKYFRFMMDQYFKDEPMDPLNKGLFTFASYNAGPGRIRQLRREAAQRGLDPNVWFGNVEQIVSERVGRETVTYVSNIYKYYVAYNLVQEERTRREAAREKLKTGTR